jgi:hypothetical protein
MTKPKYPRRFADHKSLESRVYDSFFYEHGIHLCPRIDYAAARDFRAATAKLANTDAEFHAEAVEQLFACLLDSLCFAPPQLLPIWDDLNVFHAVVATFYDRPEPEIIRIRNCPNDWIKVELRVERFADFSGKSDWLVARTFRGLINDVVQDFIWRCEPAVRTLTVVTESDDGWRR